MKRVLFASAAAVGFAGLASALTFSTSPFSGQVTFTGTVPNQCAITFNNPQTNGSGSGSLNSYTVAFGNLDTNKDGLADGGNYAAVEINAVCNGGATLSLDNANPVTPTGHGLANSAAAPAGFTNHVAYDIVAGPFVTDSLAISAPGAQVATYPGAFNYSGVLSLTTRLGTEYLVAGSYQDTIYMTITPGV